MAPRDNKINCKKQYQAYVKILEVLSNVLVTTTRSANTFQQYSEWNEQFAKKVASKGKKRENGFGVKLIKQIKVTEPEMAVLNTKDNHSGKPIAKRLLSSINLIICSPN